MANSLPSALILLGLLLLAAVAVAWLLRWLIVTTEGVFLGRRVVVWLYDRAAGEYDDIKQFDPDSESAFVAWPLARRLLGWAEPLVLDVATGTGRLPTFLLQEPLFTGRVVGLEASREMLRRAAAKLDGQRDRVAWVRQSAQRLPFPDEAFAAVTCLEALEFLPDAAEALSEMVRVLEPGGYLLATRRCGPDEHLFLTHALSREELERILVGLGLVEVQLLPWQVEYELVWARRLPDG